MAPSRIASRCCSVCRARSRFRPPPLACSIRVERDLRDAIVLQRQLEAQRPATPKHAPLRDTELAGRLVRHDGAPLLPRAAEAKKTLANLFAAPGRIRVGLRTIAVDLAPAATALERRAFRELLDTLNRENLSLPGDERRRRLKFRCRIE